jgi:hypothetical protein
LEKRSEAPVEMGDDVRKIRLGIVLALHGPAQVVRFRKLGYPIHADVRDDAGAGLRKTKVSFHLPCLLPETNPNQSTRHIFMPPLPRLMLLRLRLQSCQAPVQTGRKSSSTGNARTSSLRGEDLEVVEN